MRVSSTVCMLIGVNLLGTPAPNALIMPEIFSLATYWSTLLARKIRTDSFTPSFVASLISDMRSCEVVNSLE